MTWYDEVLGSSIILRGIGNHELFDSNYEHPYTRDEIYNLFTAPYIDNWNVVYPSQTDSDIKSISCWYKDYNEQKIRFIMLDCMYWNNAQNNWLQSVLEDALQNQYSVICADHYVPGAMTTIPSNFTSLAYKNGTVSSTFLNAAASASVQSFINSGGEFICWLGGHVHKDIIGTLTNYPDQLVIISAGALTGQSYNDTNRSCYTDADTYNLISFEPYRKIISLARIGAQYDQYLRYKGTIAIDWENKKIV